MDLWKVKISVKLISTVFILVVSCVSDPHNSSNVNKRLPVGNMTRLTDADINFISNVMYLNSLQ